MVEEEGEMVHPFCWANEMVSAGEGRKRSCWAEARGREVYDERNESEISVLWGWGGWQRGKKRKRKRVSWVSR